MRFIQKNIARYFPLIVTFLTVFISCGADDAAKNKLAEANQRYKEAEEHARGGTFISLHSVSAPIGRFLLMRTGPNVCVLRFTDIHRGEDARPPTWWHEGGESEYAEYDWYYQWYYSSGDFFTVESGHHKLYQKPAVGIGRLRFPVGNNAIRCGSFPFRLRWWYPSHVSMTGDKGEVFGVELAPTKWKEISEVNVRDSRLKWYRYDEKRKDTYISVDELW